MLIRFLHLSLIQRHDVEEMSIPCCFKVVCLREMVYIEFISPSFSLVLGPNYNAMCFYKPECLCSLACPLTPKFKKNVYNHLFTLVSGPNYNAMCFYKPECFCSPCLPIYTKNVYNHLPTREKRPKAHYDDQLIS